MKNFFRFFFLPFTVFVFLQGCFSQASGDITPEQAESMLSSGKNITALDVRTPGEFAAGHIPGAINIDIGNPKFASLINSLDKNGEYVVYCRSGIRSAKAAGIMKEAGFKKAHNMKGGISAWGGPLE